MQNHQNLFEALRNLSNITQEDFRLLQPKLSAENLDQGADLFREGEVFTKVAFIASGLVKKFYLTEDGKEFVKEFSTAGEIVAPYSALLQKKPALFSVRALEKTQLLTTDWEVLQNLFSKSIHWMQLGKRVAEMHFISREQREFEFMAYSAAQRYDAFRQKYAHLEHRIKKQDIAAYLGISPVSLSRISN